MKIVALWIIGTAAVDQFDVTAWKRAGVHSADSPGPHKDRASTLVPTFNIHYGVARVFTPHPRTDHIIAHWVEDADGNVLAFNDISDEETSLSALPLPRNAAGELSAFSHSTTYGTWRASEKVTVGGHPSHSEL